MPDDDPGITRFLAASNAIPPRYFIPLNTVSETFRAACPTSVCVIFVILPRPASPTPKGEDETLDPEGPDVLEDDESRRPSFPSSIPWEGGIGDA